MVTRELGWELWRTFDAVLRDGSLSAAARELGLTQPTAGRHIAELEAALSAGALFTRSGRGLQPTETAKALGPHALAMASAAAALVRTASAPTDAAAGVIRISASEVIGAEVLPAILAKPHQDHPALVFELLLTNSSSDLLRRDADLAVRMTSPQQQALVAKAVGRIHLGLYAHREYLARSGPLGSFEDLADHAMIGFDRDEAVLRSIHVELARLPAFSLRTDNQLAKSRHARPPRRCEAHCRPALRPVRSRLDSKGPFPAGWGPRRLQANRLRHRLSTLICGPVVLATRSAMPSTSRPTSTGNRLKRLPSGERQQSLNERACTLGGGESAVINLR